MSIDSIKSHIQCGWEGGPKLIGPIILSVAQGVGSSDNGFQCESDSGPPAFAKNSLRKTDPVPQRQNPLFGLHVIARAKC